MFPFLPSSEKRRAAVRFAGLPAAVCLLAVCLCAVAAPEAWAWEPYVHDAAPGQVPKNDVRSSDDPCPDNITPETWSQSSTLWRWVYRTCKPEGSPEQYKVNPEDMELTLRWFITKGFADTYNLPEYDLIFEELTPGICRVAIVFQTKSFDAFGARSIAERAVYHLVRHYRWSGYSPAADSMLIAARAFAKGDPQGARNMYAVYDTETGLINYGKSGYWQ